MAKNKTPKTTVNVNAVKKEVQKMAKDVVKSTPASQSHVELPPGVVKRESPLEQQIGPTKYKQMIHDHNQKNKHILDRLPFTFPKKKKIRSHLDVVLECPECGATNIGSELTYGLICSSCNKFVKPINTIAQERGYHKN